MFQAPKPSGLPIMQLARVVLPWDATECVVDPLLNRSELNFLQLDFVWPASWLSDARSDETLFGKWASGFLAQMKIVHKALFLRPELCVLSNAGGGDTIRAMEAVAAFLVEHGSSDLPIAAVRGENLLSSIEWLPNENDLRDRQIFSAHAQIGGEPMAAALVEGARIVMTGAYDSAAPFLAAAASRGLCGWGDVQCLGNIAAASQFENLLINIDANGDIELAAEAQSQLDRVRAIASREHADVSCDYSEISLTPSEQKNLLIANVVARPAESKWKVRETYDAGFRATVLIETPAQHVTEVQDFCLNNVCAAKDSLQVLATDDVLANRLVRVQLGSGAIRECQQSFELLQSWLRQSGYGAFAEPLPSIVHLTETVDIEIPVDRLTLSVDTRPANEWM